MTATATVDYQRIWVEAVNRGDVSTADRSFAHDVVIHITGMQDPLRGLEVWKAFMAVSSPRSLTRVSRWRMTS